MGAIWPSNGTGGGSGGGGGGGITGLTIGKIPQAATSSTLADGPMKVIAGSGPQNRVTNVDGGSTNGNGALNLQPSGASGNYGAGLSFDNSLVDGGGGSILWNLLASNSNTGPYQKWFGIYQAINALFLISTNGNFYFNDTSGDFGDSKMTIGGHLKFTKGGQPLYSPATPSNWASAAPSKLFDAMDRMAAWAAGLGGAKP